MYYQACVDGTASGQALFHDVSGVTGSTLRDVDPSEVQAAPARRTTELRRRDDAHLSLGLFFYCYFSTTPPLPELDVACWLFL